MPACPGSEFARPNPCPMLGLIQSLLDPMGCHWNLILVDSVRMPERQGIQASSYLAKRMARLDRERIKPFKSHLGSDLIVVAVDLEASEPGVV